MNHQRQVRVRVQALAQVVLIVKKINHWISSKTRLIETNKLIEIRTNIRPIQSMN